MPCCNTPPGSPIYNNDEDDVTGDNDMDNELFSEHDVAEVIEDDILEEPSEEEEDEDEDEIIPEREDAKYIFTKHSKGVLCSAFHPQWHNIIASGGMDDMAYVWDCNNDNIPIMSKVHTDSVEMIAFSYDGKYLASSDLCGNINVWNTSNYNLVQQFELEDELSWTQWHHRSNILISSTQKGLIYIFKVFNGDKKIVMTPFGQVCNCGKVFPDGKRLACGYTEGNLKIIDMKLANVIFSIKLNNGSGAISCLDVYKDNNLVICGCDDGDIVLVNSQSGKIVSILNSNKITNLNNYIETIAFCKDPTYNVAASGSLDGNLIIWDITNQTLRYQHNFSSSVNHLLWHPNKPIVYTCHTDGVIHVYDSKAGNVLRKLMGHRKCIFSMALSSDAQFLVTTAGDNTVRVYENEETD